MNMKTIIPLAIATILTCNQAIAQSETGLQAVDKTSKYRTNSTNDPFVFNPDLTYGEVKDVDGNVYNTITIGKQTWMAENLKTTHYNDSTALPYVPDFTVWSGTTDAAFCWYNNDEGTYKNTYGALYNWFAVNSKKIAPVGWHVPSFKEWTIMENYLISNGFNYDGTTTGNSETNNKIAKSLSATTNWEKATVSGSVGNEDFPTKRNASGFTALPGSHRDQNGYFGTLIAGIGSGGFWWSSSEYDAVSAFNLDMYYNEVALPGTNNYKRCGFSVRCVKDSVSTTAVNLIESKGNNKVKLYPNPVINQLQINYESTEPGKIQIEIIDMHGKVWDQLIQSSQSGTNHASISLVQLPAGLYLFSLQSSNKHKIIKFIKN